jgi:hypothetical protein
MEEDVRMDGQTERNKYTEIDGGLKRWMDRQSRGTDRHKDERMDRQER